MAKDTYYFSHDSNARNDIKIVRLRRALGMEGYGIYFALIEVLREQECFKLPLDALSDIAFDLHTSDEKVKTVVMAYDLFVVEENNFFSARLLRSMDEFNTKRQKYVDAGRKGGEASLKHRLSIGQPLKESKVKEINIEFNVFWSAYDKKVGDKDKLEKKWILLTDQDRKQIIIHVKKYKEAQPEKKFRKDPQTYLNNKSWNDEIIGSFDSVNEEYQNNLPDN